MRDGMMRKVLETWRGPAAVMGLLVAVVVTLLQPLPAFASCIFTVTSSNLPGVQVGNQITVNPCQYVVATGGVQATGQATTVQILLKLGIVPSAANQASVAINPTPGIVTVNNVNTGISVKLQVTTNGLPALVSATLAADHVVSGGSVTGTVTLSAAAPAGGLAVTLSSGHATVAVPASVTVPAGQTSATFTATATIVSADTNVIVSATHAAVTKTAGLLVQTARLQRATLIPRRIGGGGAIKGTVSLTAPAPSQFVVTLTSADSSLVTVPQSVTVQARATSATFEVKTQPVTAEKLVAVTAEAAGVTKTAAVVLTPPPPPRAAPPRRSR